MRNITVLITNFITKYKIYIGFDAVVEWIKPLSEALAPANVLGKTVKHGLNA